MTDVHCISTPSTPFCVGSDQSAGTVGDCMPCLSFKINTLFPQDIAVWSIFDANFNEIETYAAGLTPSGSPNGPTGNTCMRPASNQFGCYYLTVDAPNGIVNTDDPNGYLEMRYNGVRIFYDNSQWTSSFFSANPFCYPVT